MQWISDNAADILGLTGAHLVLALLPLVIGLAVALPVGWAASRSDIVRPVVVGVSGLLYTIPSLALFVLLPQLLGTKILDPVNIVVALSVYTVALLVRTVCDGLLSVPFEVRQAAQAIGYRGAPRFFKVDLPLAVPVIAAGLRVACVSNVSLVSVAALLGVPQLGMLFTQGFQLRFLTPIVLGIVLSVVLALVLDAAIVLLGRRLTPWERRVA